ncbi:hypothetical protein [Treponema sp.]|jgi:hypothetical protein|uniref:hypothetical protein n=1 Tax=Treponema sp. TaxID=166 RepID=UPI0025FB322F|nr:hypothetical protein [Treponema sp.]MBR4322401.1 hypothetical protein [Treponema sp.]
MQYLDKLKKERSLDRVIFLAGMVLAFIGFLVPAFFLKESSGVVLKNVFGAAAYFNKAPSAYNSTFIIITWLCTIAGIVLFFITKTIIGDIIATLIALAFQLASIVSIAPSLTDPFGAYSSIYTSSVTPFFGYTSVGGYLVIVGLIIAVVGSVLGAAHIQHPDQTK